MRFSLSSLNSFFVLTGMVLFPLFVLSLFFASPSYCLENKSSADLEITEFRIKLLRIQEGISNQENNIQKAENQERNLLFELEILDKKREEQQVKLTKYEEQIVQQQALIKKETSKLNVIHSEKNNASSHLGKRIKAYYTMGNVGLLNVTFSTKALPELLQFHDAYNEMLKYDQNLIGVYKKTIDNLERTNKALTLQESVLQDFMDHAMKGKKEIIKTTEKKKALLTHIRTQTKLHKQAIIEMEQVSDALSNALVALKNKANTQKYRFSNNKGRLPPPVDGVIVTLFQEKNTNKLGIARKSPGITLEAADGTKIKAIGEGSVLFSGYLRGYGNTVIIHHGYQYYSVTSRIEKLTVHQGDSVKEASMIGIMGDAATLFEGGLYFEIRHGKNSLDPILWLDPNRLSLPEEISN